jgi:hypothetical protein
VYRMCDEIYFCSVTVVPLRIQKKREKNPYLYICAPQWLRWLELQFVVPPTTISAGRVDLRDGGFKARSYQSTVLKFQASE